MRIGVPEALGGSYVGVVWSLASGPASGPLWCFNEDFRLSKPHTLIIRNETGNKGGLVG